MILLLGLAALAAAPRGLTNAFPAEGVTSITVVQPSGSVAVRAEAGLGMIDAVARPEVWEEGCAVEPVQSGATITITVADPPGPRTCSLDWTLVVPAHVAVTVTTGAGGVHARGLDAPLVVTAGNGKVVLTDHTGDLTATLAAGAVQGNVSGRTVEVKVGNGGVHLDGLIHPVTATVALGNIGLTYGLAPRGEVRAVTGAGAVTVLLPAHTPVAIGWERVIGPKRVELPEDEGAPTRLTLGAGVGSVLVDHLGSERGRKRARVPRERGVVR